MENLQPPTPKEEVIVAKNPFETDFDLKCNSSIGGGGGPVGIPTSAPSMFHSSAPGAGGMMPNNSIPGNTPHYFQKQYHSAYPASVFGMGGPPHGMGGPPGSSMMYPPGMGPDSHPGNSPLFHGPTSHPHAPPPPHHPSHMASSPMMRMPGAPPPPPGNMAAMNAAEMAVFNPAAHLNPHMMQHQHPSPLPSSTPVMRTSQALPPEPPSPKRGSNTSGGGASSTSFSNIAGHQTPQNSSASESGAVTGSAGVVSGGINSISNPSASVVDSSDSSDSQPGSTILQQQQPQSLHHLSPMASAQMQNPNNPASNSGPPGALISAMGPPNTNLPPGASPVNANAPITHLNFPICASCRQDILDGDDRLDCFSGCVNNSYHRMCAGLSKVAYDLFMQEQNVEWACDICVSTKQVPLIKTRPMPPGHMECIPGGNNPGGASNFASFNMSQQNMSVKSSTLTAN